MLAGTTDVVSSGDQGDCLIDQPSSGLLQKEGEGEEVRRKMENEEAAGDALPDEVWALVFRLADFAANISAVCKRWNDIYVNCYKLTFFNKLNPVEILQGLTVMIGLVSSFFFCQSLTVRNFLFTSAWEKKEKYERSTTHLIADAVVEKVFIAASHYGGPIRLVKELLQDSRVDPSSYHNLAIRTASCSGSTEVLNQEALSTRSIDS